MAAPHPTSNSPDRERVVSERCTGVGLPLSTGSELRRRRPDNHCPPPSDHLSALRLKPSSSSVSKDAPSSAPPPRPDPDASPTTGRARLAARGRGGVGPVPAASRGCHSGGHLLIVVPSLRGAFGGKRENRGRRGGGRHGRGSCPPSNALGGPGQTTSCSSPLIRKASIVARGPAWLMICDLHSLCALQGSQFLDYMHLTIRGGRGGDGSVAFS